MTAIIILALTIWAISAVTKSAKQKRAERNRQAQIARINAENMKRRAEAQRMREEFKARQLEAKLEVERMVAIEREQIRQAKEIEKHEAWLRKHDEEIAKAQFTISKATSDIEHLTEQISEFYGLLDVLQNQQIMAVPGSKADITAQSKIITLQNKIHSAENRLNKAKFDKEQAERKIA